MPGSLMIQLQGEKDKKHGYYMASMLHGALMELIDSSYVEMLHQNGVHPVSQYVIPQKDRIVWVVNCLTEEAEAKILPLLQDESFDGLYLRHREEQLHVINKEYRQISFRELIHQFYFEEKSNILKIKFVSPTAFKSAGEYSIFPSVRLIFQSLMMKYDAASEENHIFSEEILEHYEKYARIIGYQLRSSSFHMEGIRIPGFQGELTIKINGPQQMVNMAWMLAEFGTYSGVGIKTSLGMGGMTIVEKEDIRNGGGYR